MEGAVQKAATGIAVLMGLLAAGCGHLTRDRADLVRSGSACADSQFTIYFDEGSTRLTRPAAQLIDETGRALRTCAITSVRVVGLADASGTPEANQSLSQRRAAVVAQALRSRGLPTPSFAIDAAGDAGALTVDGRENPVRRRAEVFIAIQPG